MKFAITAALFVLVQQQQPAPQASGRIEGTVLRGESMEPISGARVTVIRVNPNTGANLPMAGVAAGGGIGGLTAPLPTLPGAGPRGGVAPPPLAGPTPLPPVPPVTTGRDGKFTVPSLTEGSYRVAVEASGYVRQEYGQRAVTRSSGLGTLVRLASGETLRDIVVRLTPTGSINGRVTDANGQPAANVPIQLVATGYNEAGQKSLSMVVNATSNDRGEYRLYWIPPGRYYLVGGAQLGLSIPLPLDSYVVTYYPGTTDINRAVVLDVKSGSEGAFDLVVTRQQPFNIRGRVVDSSSSPLSAVALNLAYASFPAGGAYLIYNGAYDSATGTFQMNGIPPGNYVVQANTGTASARVPVEVTNADIEGLTVVVSNGLNIAGQVRVDGGGALPSGQTRVQMKPIVPGNPSFPGFAPQTQSAADGTFKFDGMLAGDYRAMVTAPNDYYVKEARFDRTDALNNPVSVANSRADVYPLQIVISPNSGQIDGLVTNEQLQPMPGVRAVLVPDKRDRTELFTAITTDQSGRFNIRRIVPGDYKLFAWESIENNGYFDPDLLKRAESFGAPVHVEESAKLNLQIKAIPPEK